MSVVHLYDLEAARLFEEHCAKHRLKQGEFVSGLIREAILERADKMLSLRDQQARVAVLRKELRRT